MRWTNEPRIFSAAAAANVTQATTRIQVTVTQQERTISLKQIAVMSLIVQATSRVPFQCSGNTCAAILTYGTFHGFSVLAGLVRTFPLALAFAGLLQSSPTAAQQAITPASQATATAGQETKQGVERNLATIIQSRSTNTRGYKVVIHNDGSATAEIGGASFASRIEPPRSQQFPPGTIDTRTLRRLLAQIGDVSKIPTGGCAKSVSFGTRTQIAYAGRTSGDLQCIRQPASGGDQALLQASEDLGRFVQATFSQLKINDRRSSSNQ